jgi:hypothetical protein
VRESFCCYALVGVGIFLQHGLVNYSMAEIAANSCADIFSVKLKLGWMRMLGCGGGKMFN